MQTVFFCIVANGNAWYTLFVPEILHELYRFYSQAWLAQQEAGILKREPSVSELPFKGLLAEQNLDSSADCEGETRLELTNESSHPDAPDTNAAR